MAGLGRDGAGNQCRTTTQPVAAFAKTGATPADGKPQR
jgi:hypothetical protein